MNKSCSVLRWRGNRCSIPPSSLLLGQTHARRSAWFGRTSGTKMMIKNDQGSAGTREQVCSSPALSVLGYLGLLSNGMIKRWCKPSGESWKSRRNPVADLQHSLVQLSTFTSHSQINFRKSGSVKFKIYNQRTQRKNKLSFQRYGCWGSSKRLNCCEFWKRVFFSSLNTPLFEYEANFVCVCCSTMKL